MIIAFVLFIIYVTVSWRILEMYYMLCEPMSCENFAKNEDLEWNA
jgi:hypothetical protein